jgi:serine/threonine protein kinase
MQAESRSRCCWTCPWTSDASCASASPFSSALGKLHQRGLVHKAVKPANILLNEATGEVRLTGFGIASRFSRERQSPHPPETIAGTLAYMEPEQTGRMNRSTIPGAISTRSA